MANISSEAVMRAIDAVQKSIADLKKAGDNYSSNAITGWNDNLGVAYNKTIQNVAGLTQQPIGVLQAALPKMEELYQIVKKYEETSF